MQSRTELACPECRSQNVVPFKERHGEGHRILACRCHACGHKFDADVDRGVKADALIVNPHK